MDEQTFPPSHPYYRSYNRYRCYGFVISTVLFLFLFTVSFFHATTTPTSAHRSKNNHPLVVLKEEEENQRNWQNQSTLDPTKSSRSKKLRLAQTEFHVIKRNVTESAIEQFFYGFHNGDEDNNGNNNNKAIKTKNGSTTNSNNHQKTSILSLSQIYWPQNNTKLILSHVPRTGMSLVISLWRVLEQVQNSNSSSTGGTLVSPSMGSVANCWDVSAASILADTAYWSNERGSPAEGRHCALYWQNTTLPLTTRLLRTSATTTNPPKRLHIVAGQLPYLGSPQETNDDAGLLPPLQYMTMVRDPKFRVLSEIAAHRIKSSSGKSKHNNSTTTRRLAEQCLDYIRDELAQGRYAGGALMSSFITPYQKAFVQYYQLYWTYERRVRRAILNMEHSDGRILFGSVDHWNETMELLSYMVPQVPVSLISYFQRSFGSTKNDNNTRTVASNIWQHLSTSERELVHTYCMWEQQLYDIAVSLHKQQVAYVRQQSGGLV